MNDFFEMLIPAITVSVLFMIVFGFAGFMRYMKYKETIALAERGLLRPERKRKQRNSLKIGVLLLVVGTTFGCSLMLVGMAADSPEPAVMGVILGILPASFGLGLIIVDRINKREGIHDEDENENYEIEIERDDPVPPHKG